MLKRSEWKPRSMTNKHGQRAMGAMASAIDKLSYEIPSLTPDEGLSEQDEMLLYALSLQAEGIYAVLDSMTERLKKARDWNGEWPVRRVRFGK